MKNIDISHTNVVHHMMERAEFPINHRLHGDIDPNEIHRAYQQITGEKISSRSFRGGIVFTIGEAKFYQGEATKHPSLFTAPMIAF